MTLGFALLVLFVLFALVALKEDVYRVTAVWILGATLVGWGISLLLREDRILSNLILEMQPDSGGYLVTTIFMKKIRVENASLHEEKTDWVAKRRAWSNYFSKERSAVSSNNLSSAIRCSVVSGRQYRFYWIATHDRPALFDDV